MSSSNSQVLRPPLDLSLYNLQGKPLEFLKAETGIQDNEELKAHVLSVQAEIYAVHPYPCIRSLAFTSLKISNHPAYDDVLKLGKGNPDAILLDLGCCVGNDTRKVIVDGYPRENVIASDLQPDFWTLGHKLFRSSQESFPIPFIAGNIFDPEFLAPGIPPANSGGIPPPAPLLARVSSLTQLQHRISVIHISSFFHLFDEAQQRSLAHLLGSLLSPLPGSIIFGSHIGVSDTEGNKKGGARLTEDGPIFSHHPASWETLWTGEDGVFNPGDVSLSTKAVEIDKEYIVQVGGDPSYQAFHLFWSVTRVDVRL